MFRIFKTFWQSKAQSQVETCAEANHMTTISDQGVVSWLSGDQPILEVSKLSGVFIADCYAVDVAIFQDLDRNWRLATFDAINEPVYWSQRFTSACGAWETFLFTVERDGMEAMAGQFQIRNR